MKCQVEIDISLSISDVESDQIPKKNRIHHMKISNKNSFFVKSISRKFRDLDFTKKISNFFPYQTSSLLSTLYHHKSESAAETVNVMIDSHFATAALEI